MPLYQEHSATQSSNLSRSQAGGLVPTCSWVPCCRCTSCDLWLNECLLLPVMITGPGTGSLLGPTGSLLRLVLLLGNLLTLMKGSLLQLQGSLLWLKGSLLQLEGF